MSAHPPFLTEVEAPRERATLRMSTGGPVSEIYRLATLHALHEAQQALAGIIDAIREAPDDDVRTDDAISAFWQLQDMAGGNLIRFRNSRGCAGQG